ncbi:MAG TPA: hypothetical protein PK993_02000 [Clostridia bacterium]|nr:hypothetical protein [Clostridia bacterium]
MIAGLENLEGLTIKLAKILLEVFKKIYKIELEIKSPNDLIINRKKVGGILTQTKSNKGFVKYVVIGIGINLNQLNFNDDIEKIATSIKKEFNIDINREKIISEFCNLLEKSGYFNFN